MQCAIVTVIVMQNLYITGICYTSLYTRVYTRMPLRMDCGDTLVNNVTIIYLFFWKLCLRNVVFTEILFRFMNKISILDLIFEQNVDCRTKCRFLTKIWMFEQNVDFWPKFRFLNKVWIFEENVDLWPKFRFLNKILVFEPNFDFWPKFSFLN